MRSYEDFRLWCQQRWSRISTDDSTETTEWHAMYLLKRLSAQYKHQSDFETELTSGNLYGDDDDYDSQIVRTATNIYKSKVGSARFYVIDLDLDDDSDNFMISPANHKK